MNMSINSIDMQVGAIVLLLEQVPVPARRYQHPPIPSTVRASRGHDWWHSMLQRRPRPPLD